MTVKDTFPYNARWDSVGLDCSTCKHFNGPEKWPDTNNASCCKKHHRLLTIELKEDGYKEWEWFCKDYDDKNGYLVTL
ncbi:MAG: hypothetical protein P9M03_01755 [Candidatus Theseobacter exili]|nr:hypothetical protein [Candidatus Theseobacter exili]